MAARSVTGILRNFFQIVIESMFRHSGRPVSELLNAPDHRLLPNWDLLRSAGIASGRQYGAMGCYAALVALLDLIREWAFAWTITPYMSALVPFVAAWTSNYLIIAFPVQPFADDPIRKSVAPDAHHLIIVVYI